MFIVGRHSISYSRHVICKDIKVKGYLKDSCHKSSQASFLTLLFYMPIFCHTYFFHNNFDNHNVSTQHLQFNLTNKKIVTMKYCHLNSGFIIFLIICLHFSWNNLSDKENPRNGSSTTVLIMNIYRNVWIQCGRSLCTISYDPSSHYHYITLIYLISGPGWLERN